MFNPGISTVFRTRRLSSLSPPVQNLRLWYSQPKPTPCAVVCERPRVRRGILLPLPPTTSLAPSRVEGAFKDPPPLSTDPFRLMLP